MPDVKEIRVYRAEVPVVLCFKTYSRKDEEHGKE